MPRYNGFRPIEQPQVSSIWQVRKVLQMRKQAGREPDTETAGWCARAAPDSPRVVSIPGRMKVPMSLVWRAADFVISEMADHAMVRILEDPCPMFLIPEHERLRLMAKWEVRARVFRNVRRGFSTALVCALFLVGMTVLLAPF